MVDGCVIQPDSIYIIVHPDYELITDAEICDGDIFFWRNNDYSTAGTYTESIFSQYGCDSTYVLNLSIFPYTSDTVTLTECTPFIWPENGLAYTASGIYMHVSGCHTSYLDLTAIQSTSNISPLSACDTYTWPVDGQTYTTSSQYSYVQGCHTEYLDLTMNFSENYLTDTIICDGEIYYWMGNNYSTAGTYFMYGLTADNCLITYEFQLTVSPSYEFTYNAAVCDYQLPYEWEGMQLTTSGVYTRTYVTTDTFACDSILVMNFTVNPTYEFVTNAGFCQGDAYSWRGIDYFVPGIYFDSLLTQYGCDSVFVLNLNVIPNYEFVTNAEICQGDAYSWRGIHYFVSGIYFDSLLTVNGCDSVYVMNLIVHPTYELVTNAEVCLGEIYQWRGNYYSASGIYFDSLVTALSCDSVFVLNLTIHPEYEFVANAEICEGNIYTWRGNNYLLSGTFYDSLLTINGCDSVFILNLTVHPEYEFVTNVSICEGGIYSWRGSDYSVSGTYIDSFLTVNFCDSVYGLNLTVHPVYELVTNVDICEGDVYLWRGNMYSVSGVFLDSLLTAYSCDSVHVLNLTVHTAYEFTTNAEICEGQQYTWNDNFYDTSGTYTLNDITINGCDSIHILNLFVHQSYEFVTYAEICDNDIYTWKNNEYSNPGIYYDNLQTIYGCDSIYILNLAVHPVYEFVTITVLCEGSVFSWRGNDYSALGTYIDSLTTVYSCDSVYILNLFVEPVYEFVTDAEICHGVVLFWRGMIYSTAGTYSTSYYTSNYCDSIYTLNLTVHPTPEAGFHASKNIVFEDDATIYFTDESVEAISWLWDFGTENAFDNSSLQNPVFAFSETREYIVWQYVENIQGCTDSVSAFIHVRPIVTLYVPNAFSPNGDGLNDEFSLIGRNVDPGFFSMRIYDRWGKLVFTSNDINITWNGKVMGSNIIAPVGVYIWIIEYSELYSNNNYFYNKTGTVTLIK
jgi:gliding motility-associated-like protein